MPSMGRFQNSVVMALAVVVLAGLAVAISTVAAPAAWASAITTKGPSAAADKFGNIFVFWKGTHGQLEEAWYSRYNRRWHGPTNLRMGTLGSEPTVAVSPIQNSACSGGHFCGEQYVYWRGSNRRHDLFLAYWNGTGWHGPVNLGMGPLASEPAASSNGEVGRAVENIYWTGTNGNVWYAYSTTTVATSARDYSGPHQASYKGHGLGPLGSSPSTTIDSCDESGLPACFGYFDHVEWRGKDGALWGAAYDTLSNRWDTRAVKNPVTRTLGGPPSAAEDPDANVTYTAWQGTGVHHLWFWWDGLKHPIDEGFGTLGSAPSLTWTASGVSGIVYAFWKGTNARLYEAYYTEETGAWHGPYNLGMGPL